VRGGVAWSIVVDRWPASGDVSPDQLVNHAFFDLLVPCRITVCHVPRCRPGELCRWRLRGPLWLVSCFNFFVWFLACTSCMDVPPALHTSRNYPTTVHLGTWTASSEQRSRLRTGMEVSYCQLMPSYRRRSCWSGSGGAFHPWVSVKFLTILE
jgi:hypothetical protein